MSVFERTFSRFAPLVLIGLAACGSKKNEAPPPAEAASGPSVQMVTFDPAALQRLGIRVEPAGGHGPDQRLQLPGTLEYNLERYAQIGTIAEGRVVTVRVRVGDKVKAGEPLATVMVPSIASAQSEYLGAQAALTVAREQERREAALLENQLTTAREAELAKSEAIKAEANLAAATAKLRLLGVATPASGASIQPNGSLTLTSPIAGVVVARDAVIGQYIQPNQSAFVVADPTTLWATIDVYESDIPYVRLDSTVDLTVDAIPGKTFSGKVALLEPQAGKATRSLRARIDVDNKEGQLRPGMFVRASVPLPDPETTGRLLVPSGAVQPLGERDVVFVEREPGKYEVRQVQVARRSARVVELSEGLAVGERIVVAGAFLLRGEVTKQ